MTANELRIGSYVMYSSVVTLNGYKIAECEEHPERFGALLLTKEWLLKFGFEEGGFNWFRIMFSDRALTYNINSKMVCLEEFDRHTKVKEHSIQIPYDLVYVHQLQNLYFTLTGKELILNENYGK